MRRGPATLVAGGLIVTAACALAAGETSVRAGDPLGAIIRSSGEALILRPAGPPLPLQPGMPIRGGDRLITRSDGRVAVRLADGSVIALHPNTDFPVDDERLEADERRGVFALLRGALRTVAGLIGRRAREQARPHPAGGATIGRLGPAAPVVVIDGPCGPGPCPADSVALAHLSSGKPPKPH